MIKLTGKVHIREDEIDFRFSRSAGPGGQNVNKLSTRVTALFDVAASENLSDYQKKRILKKLKTWATKDGIIQVASQKYRTQKANRRAALERLTELLTDALKKRKPRRKTKPPKYAKEKRLAEKKRRGELKKLRQQKDFLF
ncbi:alternative ribosome rescue aminoacyl-tRNA hydrolase ArfB [Planctomycetota bacterium]